MPTATTTEPSLTPIQTELLRRADSIFDSLAKTVNQAKDFASEQIPDIAFQYVAWGRGYLTAYEVIGTICVIVGLWSFVRVCLMNSLKLPNDRINDPHAVRFIAGFAGLGMTVAGAIITLTHLKEFMMVWFAPKVWLITEIVNLVRR